MMGVGGRFMTTLRAIFLSVFAALIGLAAVIVIRLSLAFRLARQRPAGWQATYMSHVRAQAGG
jgi:hypothetical protein